MSRWREIFRGLSLLSKRLITNDFPVLECDCFTFFPSAVLVLVI